MAAVSARALRAVAEVDRARLWRRDGVTSMSSWLAGVAEAYRAGRLSWDQLRPLTRFATAETDERWAEHARAKRPAWLWREARGHERVRAREAEEARRQRSLRLDWDRERSVLSLRLQDGAACRFPGCERKRWLNAHHLVHWAEGGGTNLDNLVLLCHAHHRLIHEGGWRTSGHPARALRLHDPGGRPLRTIPSARGMREPLLT